MSHRREQNPAKPNPKTEQSLFSLRLSPLISTSLFVYSTCQHCSQITIHKPPFSPSLLLSIYPLVPVTSRFLSLRAPMATVSATSATFGVSLKPCFKNNQASQFYTFNLNKLVMYKSQIWFASRCYWCLLRLDFV